MKQFLTILTLVFSSTIFGQTTTENDSITLCSQNLKAPSGCATNQKNKIKCTDYEISWNYVDEGKLKGMENSFLEMGNMLDNFKKKKITCYLLGNEVKGYKISYKNQKETTYQIYTSGVVNGQSVIVIFSLNKEPNTNDDLPEFTRQIIRFTK